MNEKRNTAAVPEHALAEYALCLDAADMDEAARQHVAHIVFDTVGIGIGAFRAGHASGMVAEDHALALHGGSGDVRLWSGRGRVTAEQAALCNGTWAEVLDYQDVVVDPRNNGHAGVTIVPAALAVADREGASGADLVTAVAAGLEVTLAILRAVGRSHRSDGRGFRTSSIAAPVGTAVACGRLVGLDRAGLLNAMGLAGACTPNGLMPSLAASNGAFGMDKDWVNGLAAQLGVNAADLARRGMTASDRVVTGERGIVASHARGDARPLRAPEGGTPNIGAFALKKFAACYGVHGAIEAALALMQESGPDLAAVDRVVVRVKADSATTLAGREISNHMAARFSLPYAVASALVRGSRSSMRDFEEPAIRDAEVLQVMDRIELSADPELTRFHDETGGFPTIVEIHSGEICRERRIDFPVGSAQRPMSWADLEAKFRELASGRWSGERLARIVEAGRHLPELSDVRAFTHLL